MRGKGLGKCTHGLCTDLALNSLGAVNSVVTVV